MNKGIPGHVLLEAMGEHRGPSAPPPTRTFSDLPNEMITKEGAALKKRIEPHLTSIMQSGILTDKDFQEIGKYIQLCAHMDIHLHHCRRLFCRKGFLDDEIREHSARDKLFKEVRKGAKAMSLHSEEERLALIAFSNIKMAMKYRDKFSHFIIKPYDPEDALVFFSSRDRDAKSIQGSIGDPMVWQYTIMLRNDMYRQINETIELANWLAHTVSHWHKRLFPNDAEEASNLPDRG